MIAVVNNYINWFLLNKDEIFNIFQNTFNEEDYNNESNKQYKIYQYIFVNLITSFVYNDFINSKLLWKDIIKKYNLLELKNKLICCGIDLQKIFDIYNLDKIESSTDNEIEYGINFIDVEQCFIVEPNEHCGVLNENIYPTNTMSLYNKTLLDLLNCKCEIIQYNNINNKILDINLLLIDNCENYLKL